MEKGRQGERERAVDVGEGETDSLEQKPERTKVQSSPPIALPTTQICEPAGKISHSNHRAYTRHFVDQSTVLCTYLQEICYN